MHALQDRLWTLAPFIILGFLGFVLGGGLTDKLWRMDPKWMFFFFMASTGGLGMLMMRLIGLTWTPTLFTMAVSSIPILYDINFLYDYSEPFSVMVNGFGVTVTDSMFILMFLIWAGDRFGKPPPTINNRIPDGFIYLMLTAWAWHAGYAFFVDEPFYAWSYIYVQTKAYLILIFVAYRIKEIKLVYLFAFGAGVCLIIQGVVSTEQRFLGVIFTAERLGQNASWEMMVGMQVLKRITGTLAQPNKLAMFVNQYMLICLFCCFVTKSIPFKLYLVGAFFAGLMAELLSASRGGWVGFAVAFVATMTLWYWKKGVSPLVALSGIGIASSGLFGVLFTISETFRRRLTEEDYGTAEIRYPLMDVAMNMIRDNPWFGVGINHYTKYMKEYDRTFDQISFIFNAPVHNTFMLIAAETGVFGLVIACAILIWVEVFALQLFWRSTGACAAVALGIFGGNIAWLLHWLADPSMFYGTYPFWMNTGMLFAIDGINRRHQKRLKASQKHTTATTKKSSLNQKVS